MIGPEQADDLPLAAWLADHPAPNRSTDARCGCRTAPGGGVDRPGRRSDRYPAVSDLEALGYRGCLVLNGIGQEQTIGSAASGVA